VALADELAAVQQAHHLALLDLQDGAGFAAGDVWDAVANLDDLAATRFATAANAIRESTTRQVSNLAVGYMHATDATAGELTPAALEPVLPFIRGGAPGPEVYQRSIVEARARIAGGATYEEAMASGRARAVSTARTDVILANRAELARGGALRPWVVGYRRVLTGRSCGFCATASTQRYRSADLLPLHPSCDCDVAEIIGEEDPGQIINQQLLDELKNAGRQDGIGQYWNGPYEVDEHGVVRHRISSVRRDPQTGQRLLGPDGQPIRVTSPGQPVRPEVVEHGELGPTLTDARHATTTADDLAPPAPAPRAKVTDPDVLAEANRRGITPEQEVQRRADQLARRRAEASARREWERSLSVDSPEVRRAAERFGVSPDEVLTARARVADVRKVAREEAARVQAQALRELDRLDAMKLRNPPRLGSTTDLGTAARRGEWDWLEQLDARERARLSRQWYGGSFGPDQIAENMANALGRDLSVDDAMDLWLDLNRRAEASGALRRGKLPSLDAYSGQIDPNDLLREITDQGYDLQALFGDDLNAAAHVASVERQLVQSEALDYLGAAANPVEGPSPYRMSFQTWEAEVREIEYALREGIATATEQSRYAELVPQFLDEPGLDFEELYARILSTARKAGEEVPDYARIPWS